MDKFTGYEEHKDFLSGFNKYEFSLLSDTDKTNVIDSIFSIYRNTGVYPVTQFTDKGIIDEIKKCYEKEISKDADISNLRFNQGGAVCRFLFPNLRDVEQGGDKRTLNKKFNDDHMLKRAIEFCLKYKNSKSPVLPSGLKDGLEMMGGGVATNFKPMNAKAIYERYCPKNGNILDFSAGYGGRMLGALTSKNNYKYTGIEPNTKTYANLAKLYNYIAKAIPKKEFKVGDIRILNGCSEDVITNIPDQFDFAFSSPPYFNLEHYCDEKTQSHIKNPTLNAWFDNYVKPTVKAIHSKLNPNCLLAVNIADYNYKGKSVKIVDRWIKETEKLGFEFLGTDSELSIQTRRGVGHGENKRDTKKEGVYLFKKINNFLNNNKITG
tara:strand:+ start:1287 stop:2423 length:1137 start_codon:yes stop_codon:yes gene_type:complete